MPLSGYKSTKVIVTLGASLGETSEDALPLLLEKRRNLGASLGETSERGRVLSILPRVGKKRYSLF